MQPMFEGLLQRRLIRMLYCVSACVYMCVGVFTFASIGMKEMNTDKRTKKRNSITTAFLLFGRIDMCLLQLTVAKLAAQRGNFCH